MSLKVVAPHADFAGMTALEEAASGRADIRILTEELTPKPMAALIANIDVIVSLHRSEGFDLTIAEGYLAGRPAIATACFGNFDFIGPEVRETLVPARLVRVRDSSGRYRGGLWAEPDVQVAAELMRRCVTDVKIRAAAFAIPARIEARSQLPCSRAALSREPWFHLVSG